MFLRLTKVAHFLGISIPMASTQGIIVVGRRTGKLPSKKTIQIQLLDPSFKVMTNSLKAICRSFREESIGSQEKIYHCIGIAFSHATLLYARFAKEIKIHFSSFCAVADSRSLTESPADGMLGNIRSRRYFFRDVTPCEIGKKSFPPPRPVGIIHHRMHCREKYGTWPFFPLTRVIFSRHARGFCSLCCTLWEIAAKIRTKLWYKWYFYLTKKKWRLTLPFFQ